MSKILDPEFVKTTGLPDDRFPLTPQEIAKVEQALAKELEQMSVADHERLLFDIHGIPMVEEEDPIQMATMLQELEEKVNQTKEKGAYEEATRIDPDYVSNTDFRVSFLRGERYDTGSAAERLVTHFDIKRDLFGGGDTLVREIRQSDLCDEAIECLYSGFFQVLPSRDAAGRGVFCAVPGKRPNVPIKALQQCMWYLFSNALQDEETQKKGVVVVICNVKPFTDMRCMKELGFLKQIHHIRAGVPKKLMGGHACCDDPRVARFMSGMRVFVRKNERHRMRPHFGKLEDILFELQTFGIPVDCLPVSTDGRFSNERHRVWLAARKTQEESQTPPTSKLIQVPGKCDVLFGRGRDVRSMLGIFVALS